MGNRYHRRDINLTIAEIVAEIKRVHDSITAPYAPTASMYKTQRKKGTATINNIVAAGYSLTSESWANFVSDHTGLQVEPQEIVNARRNDSIRKKSKASWADRRKPQVCLCGFSTIGNDSILSHRKTCVELRSIVHREIIRIQGGVGRVPTSKDWQSLADKSLPSMTWMIRHWGKWSEIIGELARTEHRAKLIEEVRREIVRISDAITHPYAPGKFIYESHRLDGNPTPNRVLREFDFATTSDGWKAFVKQHIHMEVETKEAKALRKEKKALVNTGSSVKIIDETGMAMQADGMPVSSAYSVPLPNGNYEVVYRLR